MYVYVHIHYCNDIDITVPSCYVTPNCIGEPINSSVTFTDCCLYFGVSYNLDGQCQPCPSTSECFVDNFLLLMHIRMYVHHMLSLLRIKNIMD